MSIRNTKWQIITGGPSSGKTTLINALAYKGYKIIPEVARIYIDEQISKGYLIDEIRKSEVSFQNKVLKLKLEIEESVKPNDVVFFDRGIWDSVAYLKIAGASDKLLNEIQNSFTYDNVFLLEEVQFVRDYARTEPQEQTQLIKKLLFDTYSQKGYKVNVIHKMTVSDRVNSVLSKIIF